MQRIDALLAYAVRRLGAGGQAGTLPLRMEVVVIVDRGGGVLVGCGCCRGRSVVVATGAKSQV